MREKKLVSLAGRYKYVLLVALLGLVLLVMPGKSTAARSGSGKTEAAQLQRLLGQIQGVGEVRLLLSEEGAVVACEGAEKPGVRLSVIDTVRCYTGLGSDRITVQKLSDVN